MRYLLDTCTFVWMCAEPQQLSQMARDVLSDPAAELLLSDVSALEISLKWQAGKIELPVPEEQFRSGFGLWRPGQMLRAPDLPDKKKDRWSHHR